MIVDGQLKNAQLEISEGSKQPGTKGRVVFDTTCDSVSLDLGNKCERQLNERDSPVGHGLIWFCEDPPNDFWTIADGKTLNRADFPALFSAYGEKYGAGDGATTFSIPDLRGYFLRGTDSGRGCDPDAATRTARPDGVAGDFVGTTQDSQNKSHTHQYEDFFSVASNIAGDRDDSDPLRFTTSTTRTTGAEGGAEARSKNFAVNFIIKVK